MKRCGIWPKDSRLEKPPVRLMGNSSFKANFTLERLCSSGFFTRLSLYKTLDHKRALSRPAKGFVHPENPKLEFMTFCLERPDNIEHATFRHAENLDH